MMFAERRRATTSTSRKVEGFEWPVIWGSIVPPKIQHFAWCAMNKGIAVRTQLRKRGMEIEEVCPMCGEENETILHSLAQCREVRRMWYILPLRLQIVVWGGTSFKNWCNKLRKIYKDNLWCSIFWSMC